MSTSRKSRYDIETKIGKGSFGKVYRAYDKEEKKQVAIKIITLSQKKTKELNGALNEIRILSSISSKYVVEYYEAFVNPKQTQLWIVMEYMKGGDLAHLIEYNMRKNVRMSEEQIWRYGLQILKGIRDLNVKKILHRDIKPANVFLSEDLKVLKLGDMNVSKILKDSLAETAIGTPYYLAPEIWNREAYDEKCDIFSLGCLMFELTTYKHPFEANSTHELHNKVQHVNTPNIPWEYSSELNEFVKKCMIKNPLDRPNALELLQDPFVIQKNEKFILEDSIEESYFKNSGAFMLQDTIQIPSNFLKLNEQLPKKMKKSNSAFFENSFVDIEDFETKNFFGKKNQIEQNEFVEESLVVGKNVFDFEHAQENKQNENNDKIGKNEKIVEKKNKEILEKKNDKIVEKKNSKTPPPVTKKSAKKTDLPIKEKKKRSKSITKKIEKKGFPKSSLEKKKPKKATELAKKEEKSTLANKTKKEPPILKKKSLQIKSKLSNSKSKSISKIKSKLSVKSRSESKNKSNLSIKSKNSISQQKKTTSIKSKLSSQSKSKNINTVQEKTNSVNSKKSSKSKNIPEKSNIKKYQNSKSPLSKKLIPPPVQKNNDHLKFIFFENPQPRQKTQNFREKTRVKSETIKKKILQ